MVGFSGCECFVFRECTVGGARLLERSNHHHQPTAIVLFDVFTSQLVLYSACSVIFCRVFLACRPYAENIFNSPPFLHMPLDFKDLQGVGIKPDLIALTGADATPGSQEGLEEVGVGAGQSDAGVFVFQCVMDLYITAFTVHDLQTPAGLF